MFLGGSQYLFPAVPFFVLLGSAFMGSWACTSDSGGPPSEETQSVASRRSALQHGSSGGPDILAVGVLEVSPALQSEYP